MSHERRSNLSLSLPEVFSSSVTQFDDPTPTPSRCLGNLLKGLEGIPGLGDLKHLSPVKTSEIWGKDNDNNPFAATFKKAAQSKPNLSISEISNGLHNQESLNTPSIELASLVEGREPLSVIAKSDDDFGTSDGPSLSSPYEIPISDHPSTISSGKTKLENYLNVFTLNLVLFRYFSIK